MLVLLQLPMRLITIGVVSVTVPCPGVPFAHLEHTPAFHRVNPKIAHRFQRKRGVTVGQKVWTK